MDLYLIPYPNHFEADFSKQFIKDLYENMHVQHTQDFEQEEYSISISDKGVHILHGGKKALFYAQKTLEQLNYAYPEKVPYLTIKDKPRFAYRSFMVDSARHFMSVENLKKIIDAASLFKFNKFHWHLVDDQGWRIQIDKYPLLTQKASIRPYSNFGKYYDKNPHGGFYTKEDMKEIVDYCAERSIEVIPEIEIPGHASAMLYAYPNLGCTGEDVDIKTHQGIFTDILCAGQEHVYQFLYDVIDEICEIFPSKYIHIGGDEAPKRKWKSCPHCQQKLKDEALDNYEMLQGYMLNRINTYVKEEKQKYCISWNESLRGGNLSKDIIIQNWSEKNDECTKRAQDGGKIIVSDFFHYYVDYPLGMTPLKKTYNYNPIAKELSTEKHENIIGVECPVWAEFIDSVEKMSFMQYPRICAVAESGWTNPELKEYENFKQRAKHLVPIVEEKGLTYAKYEKWDPGFFNSIWQVVKFFVNAQNKQTIKAFLSR